MIVVIITSLICGPSVSFESRDLELEDPSPMSVHTSKNMAHPATN